MAIAATAEAADEDAKGAITLSRNDLLTNCTAVNFPGRWAFL